MDTLAIRLKRTLSEKGLTQEKLANMTGISQNAISLIINGKTQKTRYLPDIAKALNVDINWLETGKSYNNISSIQSMTDDYHLICIQQLDAIAVAGTEEFKNENYPDIIRSIYFSEQGLYEIVGIKNPQGVYLISVPTDSMQPTINKGDIVFVDTKTTAFSTDGVYIFDLNGHTYIKRLQRLPTGTIQAISDNTNYPPFEITEELFNTAVIRGKFIRVLPVKPIDL